MAQTEQARSTLSVQQLAEQLESIASDYQAALDASEQERGRLEVQVEMYKAKTASLQAACESLTQSLKNHQPTDRSLPTDVVAAQEQIRALTAERDSLQKALQQADERIRQLETGVKQESPAAPASVVEPTPAPVVEPAAVAEPAPIAEPAVAAQPPVIEPEIQAAPAEEPEAAEFDFEEQKQTLLMMQEELAKLEARLQEE